MKRMKRCSFTLALFMLFSIIQPIALNKEVKALEGVTEYINSNFDDYTGRTTLSTGTSVKLQDYKVYGIINNVNYIEDATVEGKSGKSLKFVSTAADVNNKPLNLTKENFKTPLTGDVVLEAKVRFDDTSLKREVFALRNIGNVSGVKPKYATLFTFNQDGTILINGKDSGEKYDAATWHKVGAIIDNNAGKVEYYLDGKKLTADGAEVLPEAWGSIFSIKFSQAGANGVNGAMYLDDLKAYTGKIFAEDKPSEPETPVAATIDGWKIRHLSGNPSEKEDASKNLVSNKSIDFIMKDVADKVSMEKVFSITSGKTYMIDTWVSVKTDSSISLDATAVPLKKGLSIKKDDKEIKYTGFYNTRGEIIKSGWTQVRIYFEAPIDADSIAVKYVIPGPAEVKVAATYVNERPEWQEVIGKFKSSEIKHPIGDDVKKMFLSWQLDPWKKETDEMMAQAVEPLMNMTEEALIANSIQNAKTRNYIDIHPEYEQMARRMAVLYSKTGKEEYARRAILIMNQFAETYGDVPRIVMDNDIFHAHGKYIPMEPLYAYDLVYNSGEWDKLEMEIGKPVRENIESWFRSSFMNMYNIHNDIYYSNIAPYGIRNAMGVAVVLNDPDIIRMMIPWMDTMFSGHQFSADGMWQEGAIAYGKQVTANCIEALKLLETCYKDPEGYVDNKYGIKLDHNNIIDRWPLIKKSNEVVDLMKFPNGTVVGVHDTWTKGQKGEKPNRPEDPILTKYIRNVELWHFGHFALTRGDEKDTTQALLTFPPMSEGLPYAAGHYHGNHLGLILWGAGMEMLPDSGYPKGNNRYFNMDTQSHNTAWVWNKDAENYSDRDGLTARPALLAYDPGVKSNKAVQLIEASSPGPVGDLTEMKRRLLLMVETEGNRSYVLDLQRLKGGQAHELFMHASEDEASEMTTDLNLTEHKGDLDQYMKEIGHEEGLTKFRSMFKDPQVATGDKDFNFTWKGKESGSALSVFMNGVEGSEAIFSQMPTNRLTQNKNPLMDAYPNWSFYRRNLVDPDKVTGFGAVYETYRDSQTPMVKAVQWKKPENEDPLSFVSVVDMDKYEDMVYISDDTEERSYDGIKFAGKAAILRKEKDTGKFVWGYVYGEGKIEAEGFKVTGEKDLKFNAVNSTGSLDGTVANTIKLDGNVPENADLNGVWLTTQFGDKSGFGMRIEGVNKDTLNVHDVPPFEVTEKGARMTFFPDSEQPETGFLNQHAGDNSLYIPRVIPGDVKVEVRQPVFTVAKEKPVDETKLTLNKTSLELTEGESIDLIASITPENLEAQKFLWSSENKDIASVDNNGKVIAIKEGYTKVTASTEDGKYKAECIVKVNKKVVDSESKNDINKDNNISGNKKDEIVTSKEDNTKDNLDKVADSSTEAKVSEELPKSGSLINMNNLIVGGLIFMAVGVVLFRAKRIKSNS